jgi:hypothetical protein
VVENHTYEEPWRVQRKCVFDEQTTEKEVNLTSRESFRVRTFLVILDSIIIELSIRKKVLYTALQEVFGILFDFRTVSNETIQQFSSNLQKLYSSDLEECFPTELIHFAGYISNINKDLSSPLKMLKHIRESGIGDVFSNMGIAV